MNQDCVCEEGCCLSDAHFTHCRSLKLCCECGRGLQGRHGERRLFYLKSWTLAWQLAPRPASATGQQWKTGILLEPDISPFPTNCVSSLFCVPVLFLKSYSENSFAPSSSQLLNLCFSPLRHYMPWKNPWANLTLKHPKPSGHFWPHLCAIIHPHFTYSKLLLYLMGSCCSATLTSAKIMKDTIDKKITGLCSWQAWNSVK